ncbi:MAG TPA: aminopeptidase [Steroidobacteraceae bacterium]|nr:aminopeptidase [Steroidobacteraceae bacterium]
MLRDSPFYLTRLLPLLAACADLSGCYYLHLAAGQLDMNRRREPIAELAARPGTDEALRRRLDFAARARDFAMTDLGLPDNGSYRTYADLGRKYATWNLFAAPEFAVEPRRWCFPIAGCVSYRGYFDERRAQRSAERLARRGFDVHVGPSIAYSTLGHLKDPVLNTMLVYGDAELAALIFHELAHQAVYAPSDSDFSEAFATVVEQEGVQRFLGAAGQEAEVGRFLQRRSREQRLAATMVETRRRLAALYRQEAPPERMRAEKAAEFERLRAALTGDGAPPAGALNNARLVAVSAYHRCVPALREELARLGGDLPAFYARMRRLADHPAERARLCPRG